MIITLGAWPHIDPRSPRVVLVEPLQYSTTARLPRVGPYVILPIGDTTFTRTSDSNSVTFTIALPSTLRMVSREGMVTFVLPEFDPLASEMATDAPSRTVWALLSEDEDDLFTPKEPVFKEDKIGVVTAALSIKAKKFVRRLLRGTRK